jgi:hypothetical protein
LNTTLIFTFLVTFFFILNYNIFITSVSTSAFKSFAMRAIITIFSTIIYKNVARIL